MYFPFGAIVTTGQCFQHSFGVTLTLLKWASLVYWLDLHLVFCGFYLLLFCLLSLGLSYSNANQEMARVSAKQQWNVCNSTIYWVAFVLWVSEGASAMSAWKLVDSWLVRCCCMVFWYFATIQTNKWLIFLQLLVGTTFSQLVISSLSVGQIILHGILAFCNDTNQWMAFILVKQLHQLLVGTTFNQLVISSLLVGQMLAGN